MRALPRPWHHALLAGLTFALLASCTDTAAPPAERHQLTVRLTGEGTVTSDPTRIDCQPTCAALFPAGSQVTLSATPTTAGTRIRWSGACAGRETTPLQRIGCCYRPPVTSTKEPVTYEASSERSHTIAAATSAA
jgi:hypothetical protein